jgi:hypothetical protein
LSPSAPHSEEQQDEIRNRQDFESEREVRHGTAQRSEARLDAAVSSRRMPIAHRQQSRSSGAPNRHKPAPSLLLAQGRSVIDVADQLGHAPTLTLDT